MSLILRAARFADHAHRGQVRKHSGGLVIPYIVHPERVAGRVTRLPESTEEMVAAAWLHDVVEDCGVTLHSVAEISPWVAELVGWLTNVPKTSGLTKRERRAKDLERLMLAPVEARIVKLADRIDNTRDSLSASIGFRACYAEKAGELREALRGTHAALEAELDGAIATLRSYLPRAIPHDA